MIFGVLPFLLVKFSGGNSEHKILIFNEAGSWMKASASLSKYKYLNKNENISIICLPIILMMKCNDIMMIICNVIFASSICFQ